MCSHIQSWTPSSYTPMIDCTLRNSNVGPLPRWWFPLCKSVVEIGTLKSGLHHVDWQICIYGIEIQMCQACSIDRGSDFRDCTLDLGRLFRIHIKHFPKRKYIKINKKQRTKIKQRENTKGLTGITEGYHQMIIRVFTRRSQWQLELCHFYVWEETENNWWEFWLITVY